MEYLNPKPEKIGRPTLIKVDMGDWRPRDSKLAKLLQELPYPAFAIYINESYLPMLEEIIIRSIRPNPTYGQNHS